MGEIRPIHRSMRGKRRTPLHMTRITLEPETNEAITQIALDIFTDCVNAGLTMQDALVAVYISGLENGNEAAKEA